MRILKRLVDGNHLDLHRLCSKTSDQRLFEHLRNMKKEQYTDQEKNLLNRMQIMAIRNSEDIQAKYGREILLGMGRADGSLEARRVLSTFPATGEVFVSFSDRNIAVYVKDVLVGGRKLRVREMDMSILPYSAFHVTNTPTIPIL